MKLEYVVTNASIDGGILKLQYTWNVPDEAPESSSVTINPATVDGKAIYAALQEQMREDYNRYRALKHLNETLVDQKKTIDI